MRKAGTVLDRSDQELVGDIKPVGTRTSQELPIASLQCMPALIVLMMNETVDRATERSVWVFANIVSVEEGTVILGATDAVIVFDDSVVRVALSFRAGDIRSAPRLQRHTTEPLIALREARVQQSPGSTPIQIARRSAVVCLVVVGVQRFSVCVPNVRFAV